jgi:hypothetical protein
VHTAGSRLHAGRPGRRTRGSQSRRIPHVGDIAGVTGLTNAFNDVVRRLRPCGTGRDLGRLAVNLAVMFAGVGESFTGPAFAGSARGVRPGRCHRGCLEPDGRH